jgi:hypothetical protein
MNKPPFASEATAPPDEQTRPGPREVDRDLPLRLGIVGVMSAATQPRCSRATCRRRTGGLRGPAVPERGVFATCGACAARGDLVGGTVRSGVRPGLRAGPAPPGQTFTAAAWYFFMLPAQLFLFWEAQLRPRVAVGSTVVALGLFWRCCSHARPATRRWGYQRVPPVRGAVCWYAGAPANDARASPPASCLKRYPPDAPCSACLRNAPPWTRWRWVGNR